MRVKDRCWDGWCKIELETSIKVRVSYRYAPPINLLMTKPISCSVYTYPLGMCGLTSLKMYLYGEIHEKDARKNEQTSVHE